MKCARAKPTAHILGNQTGRCANGIGGGLLTCGVGSSVWSVREHARHRLFILRTPELDSYEVFCPAEGRMQKAGFWRWRCGHGEVGLDGWGNLDGTDETLKHARIVWYGEKSFWDEFQDAVWRDYVIPPLLIAVTVASTIASCSELPESLLIDYGELAEMFERTHYEVITFHVHAVPCKESQPVRVNVDRPKASELAGEAFEAGYFILAWDSSFGNMIHPRSLTLSPTRDVPEWAEHKLA